MATPSLEAELCVPSHTQLGMDFRQAVESAWHARCYSEGERHREQGSAAMVARPVEGKEILVIEDIETTREVLVRILEDAGATVRFAENGREALELLQAGYRPDLIVLDMLLPVLDGWHFLDELKRLPGTGRIPIMITTATVLSREWALTHGCAGFVRKPIDPPALLREVSRCC
jgi:CheY-like chemotaxis protein